MPTDPKVVQQVVDDAQKRYNELYKFVYDTIFKVSNDPRMAGQAASDAVAAASNVIGSLKTSLDYSMAVADTVLAQVFAVITAFRKEMTETVNSTTAEVLNEFLGTEFRADQIQAPVNGDPTLEKATNVGNLILDRLEYEFTRGEPVTMESGAKGARTFAGYSVNFAIQNAIIATLGECFPKLQLDNLRELGVEVAQNLGLGRLIRRALSPLVDNTISKPYTRQLQRKYQMDLMGTTELARAYLAGRFGQDKAKELLKQHGLSDDQVDELIAQHTPRLHAEEFNLLVAMGQQLDPAQSLQDLAQGMPADLVSKRQTVQTWKRTSHVRDRVLQSVLSQVSAGFLQPTDLNSLMDRLLIPDDEKLLWAQAAGYLFERVHKRLSHAEMLFLYEASQVTDEDVRTWLQAEGFSQEDVERSLTVFRLRGAEAANKSTGGAAARAIHQHNEHVSYVTDYITDLFGRKPTTAELDHWVKLLDAGDRTKQDFVRELKGLDPSGSAIPTS